MKLSVIVLTAMLTFGTLVYAQDSKPQPRRQGPPTVQCDEMKKLMKAVQDHRQSCEVCKTNLPMRGMGQGNGRGPGGPPQKR